ncbi:MAG: CPXCG motif-containing cysteine-rich protein [Oligoflexia bacterium]|nr:CPXCG motif-containing cysteine-rich protein [Oligoflexia bacterium]
MESITSDCPYCDEPIAAEFDGTGAGTERFIVDCDVCCKPIEFVVRMTHDGEYEFDVKTDAD